MSGWCRLCSPAEYRKWASDVKPDEGGHAPLKAEDVLCVDHAISVIELAPIGAAGDPFPPGYHPLSGGLVRA